MFSGLVAQAQEDVVLEQGNANKYDPSGTLLKPYPKEEFDFSVEGPFSIYNWELFVYIPLFIADRFIAAGKYVEAQRWIHAVFDPTRGAEVGSSGECISYWRVKPLRSVSAATGVEDILEALASEEVEGDSGLLRERALAQAKVWEDNPFDPHALARARPQAIQRAVVMKYLDLLVGWADSLFRRDSIETNNEASQIYFIARQLLGDRPVRLSGESRDALTYAEMKDTLKLYWPALQELEDRATGSGSAPPRTGFQGGVVETTTGAETPSPITVPHVPDGQGGLRPYFCTPPNERMLSLWDVVDDRLYKLRNCLNIDGIFRQLPLFQPPIDPAAVAGALAGGADLASAIGGLSAPVPFHRFERMLAFAKEVVSEVQRLGGQLLSALEKGDAERLARIRAEYEARVSDATMEVRKAQEVEASRAQKRAFEAKEAAVVRRNYFDRLLAEDPTDGDEGRGEAAKAELAATEMLEGTRTIQSSKTKMDELTAQAGILPSFSVGFAGISSPTGSVSLGGQQLAAISATVAAVQAGAIAVAQSSASLAQQEAVRIRRREEWAYQRDLAGADADTLTVQISELGARMEVVARELELQEELIAQALEIGSYYRSKFTNEELYSYLEGELSGLYNRAFNLAHDVARRAQRCFQFELAEPTASFVKAGHWENRTKGLLAGERLAADLREMESAYLERNRREYELRKRFSLREIDPVALAKLKSQGSCLFELREEHFNVDHPSHYMRRIRRVKVTIPAVTGPYDSLGATLTYLRGELRAQPNTGSQYLVADLFGASESISLSTADSDGGYFESRNADSRYMPFENKAAANSQWSLSLPSIYRSFDYSTIEDVVVELEYTAREGGMVPFGEAQQDTLKSEAVGSQTEKLVHVVSLRGAYPEAFHALSTGSASTVVQVDADAFPSLPFDGVITPISVQALLVRETAFDGPISVGDLELTVNGGTLASQSWGYFGDGIDQSSPSEERKVITATIAASETGSWEIGIASGLPQGAGAYEDLVLVLSYQITVPS